MAKELAVTTKKVTDLQVVQGLTNLVRQVKEDLASSKAYFEANADFGADRFASVSFLSKNQRGQFIDHGNDKENLGDFVYAIFTGGAKLFTLWVEGEDRPLIQTADRAEAIDYIYKGKEAEDPRFELISEENLKQVYLADLVLLNQEDLRIIAEGGEIPEVKLKRLRLSPVGKIRFDEYMQKLFKGSFPEFKKNTTLNSVITKVYTVDEKSRSNLSYINYAFSPVSEI